MDPAKGEKSKQDKFDGFLLQEYSNIVQAHFKSQETISTFFRYFLLIMTIPISAVAIIPQIVTNNVNFSGIISNYNFPISILFFCISLIGIGIFCYIVNLRLDAILYARTVNGIRKYYYDRSGEDINLKLRMKALPQSPHVPHYLEKSLFLPVVSVFGIMNVLYFSISLCILNLNSMLSDRSFILSSFNSFSDKFEDHPWIVLLSFFFFFSHFLFYWIYAHHRETGYLKSNIIGVDIDGVLNKHREQFCKLLKKILNKTLDPEEILIMPVNEDARLDISRDDERAVFNDTRYWSKMPVDEEAPERIEENLKNIFKLKIHLFTYRPWPDSKNIGKLIEKTNNFIIQSHCDSLKYLGKKSKNYLRLIFPTTSIIKWILLWPYFFIVNIIRCLKGWLLKLIVKHKCLYNRVLIREKILKRLKGEPLKNITEEWLNEHKIIYDKFVFEKGNDYSSDPKGEFTNRFHYARKKKIKFFIEDDIEKAIRLSFICDVVFLLSHPYNDPSVNLPLAITKFRRNLPSNIIRVENWSEIKKQIRRLS